MIGKKIRLDSFIDARPATVVGVLEPCVPYPQDTEIIANIVTSAHHLSATMDTGRIHRMTELFARLAPGADLEQARAELRTVYGAMKREHPEAYPAKSDYRISAVRLRDQLTSGARTILLVLMAASLLVFVIACSNVANLILARTVRRESELGIRAALGATTRCFASYPVGRKPAAVRRGRSHRRTDRRTAGIRARAIRFPLFRACPGPHGGFEHALGGVGLAVVAAALLAFVPRLPSSGGAQGFGLSTGGPRVTGAANRKLRVFAVVQIAASFVLVASAGAFVKTLLSLEAAQTPFDTHQVLAVDVPVMHEGRTPRQIVDYYREATRRIRELPGVQNVAVGSAVPWRTDSRFAFQIAVDGHVPAPGEEHPRAMVRIISPGFFATLGLPLIEGRDFNDADRDGSEQ